jgi:hypothetical protein
VEENLKAELYSKSKGVNLSNNLIEELNKRHYLEFDLN